MALLQSITVVWRASSEQRQAQTPPYRRPSAISSCLSDLSPPLLLLWPCRLTLCPWGGGLPPSAFAPSPSPSCSLGGMCTRSVNLKAVCGRPGAYGVPRKAISSRYLRQLTQVPFHGHLCSHCLLSLHSPFCFTPRSAFWLLVSISLVAATQSLAW